MKKIRLVLVFLAGVMFGILVFRVGWEISLKGQVKEGVTEDLKRKGMAGKISLGEHFVVGYRDVELMGELIKRGWVGGVYVSERNVRGKSIEEVRGEIEGFQQVAKDNGLLPLMVMTDQEGGVVEKLSPPLEERVSLGSLAAEGKWERLVEDYAQAQAEELVGLGVNVNLAPVVDLMPERTYRDRYTKLSKRAISDDPYVVTQMARVYCRELVKNGVMPVLKHFPGLGKAIGDTHMRPVRMRVELSELRQEDWVPFRAILESKKAFLMLSHVILTQVDGEHAVSGSKKIVEGIIREEWGYDGVVITDDLGMGAVKEEVEKVAVNGLNAGVDILLVVDGEEVYFKVFESVIKAWERGDLDEEKLWESQQRLRWVRARL